MKHVMTDNERRLCRYILNLMEGDTYMIDDMYKFLEELGAVDKEGFGTDELYGEVE